MSKFAVEKCKHGNTDECLACYDETIESLRQRVKELEDYLREVAAEAGLPPETLDIATCRHIAHQVKSIREASIQFMEELTASQQRVKVLDKENMELHLAATYSEKELLEERQKRFDGNADSSKEMALLAKQLKSCLANKWKARCEKAEAELAALKAGQGEPEIWVRDSGDGHWEFSEPGFGTPLYTSAPTIQEGYVMVQDKAICYLYVDDDGNYQVDRCDHPSEMLIPVFKKAAPKPEE